MKKYKYLCVEYKTDTLQEYIKVNTINGRYYIKRKNLYGSIEHETGTLDAGQLQFFIKKFEKFYD